MAYAFKHITVAAFEIHPAIALVKAPQKNFLQTNFAFLTSKSAYAQQYWTAAPVTTASFSFKGMPARQLEKSHFWKSLCDSRSAGNNPDVWALQIPFVGRYQKADLQLHQEAPGITCSIVPMIYLCTMGWSIQLKIDVEGDIKKAQLIDLMGWLAGGANGGFSLRIGTATMTVKEVFRHFNNLVREEVYVKGTQPDGGIKIFRQQLLSVNSYEGSMEAYPKMPSDEKALMRSLLYGRSIQPLNLVQEERDYPVTKTIISGSGVNFALSDFERGTLIFLQREANNPHPVNRENKRKVVCFASNCKNCLLLSYLMWQFYTQSGSAVAGSVWAGLRDDVLLTLKSMPVNFSNTFCKNLFAQHSGIAGLLKQ
ncbi:hypothetical protein [Paraflavitalea pollutisoli]|uniref:hypothetical protein n=1 Tax=Paraflavitalea pollutisoli TaxID=3034143 RepID=UPI0023EE0ACF|nr:hypothetical protein [Paraflavitalea sp. H1-2-19X]